MSLAVWWSAFRPATLWAAFAPVLVGTACAQSVGCFALGPAVAALAGAVLIQIGTNFANDLFDFEKGADSVDRLGPRRAVQSGLLSPRAMTVGIVVAFGSAVLVGGYLVAIAGVWIVVIGALSIAAGIAYTAGPYPLGYHGLGDVFVFGFFGPVAVLGTVFVQCRAVPAVAVSPALAVGALTTAILVVNNLRDRASDAAAGKRTLAVLLGPRFARVEYGALVLGAFALPVFDVLRSAQAWSLLPVLVLPWAVAGLRFVAREDGARLNLALARTARLLLAFSALLALGQVLGAGRSIG